MSEMSETENSLEARVERHRTADHQRQPFRLQDEKPAGVTRSRLSTNFLGLGASVAVILRAGYGFSIFLPEWRNEPYPVIAMTAWILLFFVIFVSVLSTQILGFRMPGWLFWLCFCLLGAVMALDLWSIWELHNIGRYASSGLSGTMALLLFLTIRRLREILIAAGILGLALVVAIGINTPLRAETLPAQIGALGLAIVPVLVGVYLAGSFRSMVANELDRVLAHSTLTSPPLSLGFLASEELARLDLEAEELLDSVATGRLSLPLSQATAARAAAIAMELRFRLLEARRETWLHHAVTESAPLGRAVTLSDTAGFAGLMNPQQRQGLLAAVWLLVNDATRAEVLPTLEITIGSVAVSSPSVPSNMLGIPISLVVVGISRNQVNVSIWESLARVGKFRDSVNEECLTIDIECFVGNPAEK